MVMANGHLRKSTECAPLPIRNQYYCQRTGNGELLHFQKMSLPAAIRPQGRAHPKPFRSVLCKASAYCHCHHQVYEKLKPKTADWMWRRDNKVAATVQV